HSVNRSRSFPRFHVFYCEFHSPPLSRIQDVGEWIRQQPVARQREQPGSDQYFPPRQSKCQEDNRYRQSTICESRVGQPSHGAESLAAEHWQLQNHQQRNETEQADQNRREQDRESYLAP